MDIQLVTELGGAIMCLESCPDSPTDSDVMCMEHNFQEGATSEISSCSQVSGFDAECSEYEEFSAAYEQENKFEVNHSYLTTTQMATGLTQAQRATLVDGMISLTDQIGLSNDTLFMAVAVIDRYLSVTPVSAALLQPVSVACLWIASKYEELASISAAMCAPFMVSPEGVSLGSEGQAIQLLLELEIGVLRALDYRLASIVTATAFKHRIFQRVWNDADSVSRLSSRQHQRLYSLTSYLTEVSLLEYQLLQWSPSMVDAAAYALAQILLGIHLDTKALLTVTGVHFEELRVVMQFLCSLHSTLYQALAGGVPYNVSRKYYGTSLDCVSATLPLTATDPRLSA